MPGAIRVTSMITETIMSTEGAATTTIAATTMIAATKGLLRQEDMTGVDIAIETEKTTNLPTVVTLAVAQARDDETGPLHRSAAFQAKK